MMKRALLAAIAVLLLLSFANAQKAASRESESAKPARRNVIIFVADGLRHGSVNAKDTPALYAVRTQGVNFANSFSLFPTFTTANASAIATGHRLGDTGDFSNGIWVGYRVFDTGNFDHGPWTSVPFLENDEVLSDLDAHNHGNYLNETTLLAAARDNGYNTAAIGKVGPTAIQDVAELNPVAQRFGVPKTIIVDDATSYNPYDPMNIMPLSIPLPNALVTRLMKLGLPLDAPARNNGFADNSPYSNGYVGNMSAPGTLRSNKVQQDWFVDVATKGVLPMFAEADKPFVMLFWSRDPDGSQHDEGDSLNQLVPGINGPTSKMGVENADHNLQMILKWLDAHPKIKANTDVFVTSDHGFATISRRELDRTGKRTMAQSAQHFYYNAAGKLDTKQQYLPSGFLAIDLAWALQTNLWDPDSPMPAGSHTPFKQVKLTMDEYYHPTDQWEHPKFGNGFIGNYVYKTDGSDAQAIVAANGGSDLIYVPSKNPEKVKEIVKLLLGFDYVGAVFVDDQYGNIPGTLPLSDIDLVGSAVIPRPSIVVAFKTFYLKPGNLMDAIQVSDTGLQEGQGNHGGFGREVTFNNMAAIGPDFKQGYVDEAPVANSDIVPTLAKILGITMPSTGKLKGRVIEEAFKGQPNPKVPPIKPVSAMPDPKTGLRTVMFMQQFDGQKYFGSACMTTSKTIEPGMCEQQ